MSLTTFHEVRFPTDIAFGSTGGPERMTEIVKLGSGREERNSRWFASRRRYDAGYGIKTLDDLHAVISFFEERRGQLHGFRFRDPLDWKSGPPSGSPAVTDSGIGIGDGTETAFQLAKTYGTGANKYARDIVKPVAGTVVIAVDGVAKSEGTHLTVDHTTGIVTFNGGSVPANGAAVTAGFEFDVPVRFDTGHLQINLDAFEAGAIPSVPLLEILP